MKKILIIFAWIKEANPFLDHSHFSFNKISKNLYKANWKDLEISVYICGIGKKAAAKIPSGLIDHSQLIIKAGTCGIIDPQTALLKMIIPASLSDLKTEYELHLSALPEKLKAFLNSHCNNGKLLTLEKPLTNKDLAAQYLKMGYSYVDMESFYIKQLFPEKTFLPVLTGTDYANSKVLKDFFKNLKEASRILNENLMTIIDFL